MYAEKSAFILLFLATASLASPTGSGGNFEQTLQSQKPNSVSISYQGQPQLRQDGDDDDDVGEIEEVGNLVSQIIKGVTSGNLNHIFQGSTGFIDSADTQTGVENILTSVAKPLTTLLVNGVQQGQKYYNITDPPAILLNPTTSTSAPKPELATKSPPLSPQLPLLPITANLLEAQAPKVVASEASPPIDSSKDKLSSKSPSQQPAPQTLLQLPQDPKVLQSQISALQAQLYGKVSTVKPPEELAVVAAVDEDDDDDDDYEDFDTSKAKLRKNKN